jgi:hypothetical protein
LIAGFDPADHANNDLGWPAEVRQAASPFVHAIKNAAKSGKFEFNPVSDDYLGTGIDWEASTIELKSFIEWLRQRNFADGFFVPTVSKVEGISNPNGPYYAVKLAAAVRAWTEVTSNPAMLNGKSPKKALEVWLRKHAGEYGLTGKDGNPNNLGIEEICKVANWKPAGGASPTPSPASPHNPVSRTSGNVPEKATHPKNGKAGFDKTVPGDDDVPF